jgi:hypothetical protein
MASRSSKHRIVIHSILLSSMALLAAPSASAREEPATRSDPPTTQPPDVPEPLEAKAVDEGRLRIGCDMAAGVGAGGGASGALVAPKLRIGWQFNHALATYLQGSIFYWASSTKVSADRTVTANGAFGYQLTQLFALTPRDDFEIAAGPSLDYLVTATTTSAEQGNASQLTSSGDPVTYSRPYVGMHGRVAVHIGGRPSADTGRRTSFAIGGDAHTTFAEGSVLAVLHCRDRSGLVLTRKTR